MGTTALEVDFLCSGVLGTNNKPLASGKVYTYNAGTTTESALYSAADKSASCANPIILDSRGAATAYADGYYKFVIKDKNDVTIATYDNMYYVVPQTEAVTVRSISTSGLTTASTPEMIEVNTAGGAITLNLVTAVTHAGLEFFIVKTNAGGSTLTVDAYEDETIAGVGTKAMTGTLEVLHIMSDGSNWMVINEPSGSAITTSSTDTLTNKTLTTPVIASFYQDAGKTKLMTTPNTASDTLCAIAATQTLTNKTLTAPTITAPAITGTSTIGNGCTLTTPTIASFANATHTHANAAGGGATLTAPTISAPTITGVSVIAVAAWIDFSPGANWTALTQCSYMKDPMGFVHLKGSLIGDATSANTITTLPDGYRPVQEAGFWYKQGNYSYRGTISTVGVISNLGSAASMVVALETISFLAIPAA